MARAFLAGKGGGSKVDSALSSTSTNPVQNKVVKAALDDKAASSHTHAASAVKAGTLAGQVLANASATATLGTAQVRNIKASTTDLTAGTSSLTTGQVYLVYE